MNVVAFLKQLFRAEVASPAVRAAETALVVAVIAVAKAAVSGYLFH